MTTKAFAHDLSAFLKFGLDDAALDRLTWKDVGPGTKLARLARDGEMGLVLYRIRGDDGARGGAAAGARADVFQPHEHPGGELYLVLRGTIVDETGRYPEGSLVWLGRGSKHTPRGEGSDTVIAVLWPEGIRA